MSDSLSMFKDCCKEAFRFLGKQYGYTVVQEGRKYNPYYLVFGHGEVRLGVLGESYGRDATVHYLTIAGFEVPYQCLAADWQPPRKLNKKPQPNQQEQILQAAKTIGERDTDILRGDMSRVDAAAQRLHALFERLRQ